MTSKEKQIRILTKNEQKRTIKGIQKPKKNVIKNYLESPFALEWPELTSVDEEEITALVQRSCSGLRKLECKPPWKEVSKYKGAERKSFIKEYIQKFQENLDPDTIKQTNETKEALSHLVLGYNAVMRGLEKDCVAGILVKKNVDPEFVTKAFLPGCATKCIPLIPLNDLDLLLKDKETLALPHACMVLGLKTSVKDESNLFYPLYVKMCEALNVEEMDDDTSSDDDVKGSSMNVQENGHSKCSHKLSETEIKSYHLKRNGNKGRRAFIPNAQEMQRKDSDSSMDFLGFKSLETQHNTLSLHDGKSENTVEEKPSNLKGDENLDFSSMILIDASGDENQMTESGELNDTTGNEKKLKREDRHKVKRKAKTLKHDSYVPAKTKRLKGNPNRKTKV